jgi:hypothetical protein
MASKGKRVTVFLFIAAVVFAGYLIFVSCQRSAYLKASSPFSEQSVAKSDAILSKAFSNRLSGFNVSGQGVVVKVLPDENSGTRHQRFIVSLASGQTLLIAHNIDIAQRISSLRERDTVQFSGEYEWNEQGGAIHKTHRDPRGRHPAGWLEHKGKKYE